MQPARSSAKPFDRGHALPAHFVRQIGAGAHRKPIDQHRAAAAHLRFAGKLHSRQSAARPQHFRQRFARLDFEADALPFSSKASFTNSPSQIAPGCSCANSANELRRPAPDGNRAQRRQLPQNFDGRLKMHLPFPPPRAQAPPASIRSRGSPARIAPFQRAFSSDGSIRLPSPVLPGSSSP